MLFEIKKDDQAHLTALDLKKFFEQLPDEKLKRMLIKMDVLELRAAFLQTTDDDTPTLYLEER